MVSMELRELWAKVIRHLAASRFYLPELLPDADALAEEEKMNHLLHHNELELALEAATALGQRMEAPPEYWLELKLAAATMGLTFDAPRRMQLRPVSATPPNSEVIAAERELDEAMLNLARFHERKNTGHIAPFCSFCGAGKNEVAAMVAGPVAYICTDCIAESQRILRT